MSDLALIKQYINDVLGERRTEFGGKHVCPFAGPELARDKLMIAEAGDKSLLQLIIDFKNSDYESALFVIRKSVSTDDTKAFQAFVNKILRSQGLKDYKNICFNPNDKVEVDGFNPRSLAPYFMVNVAHKKVLSQASKILGNTNYYDNLPDEYLKFLRVKRSSK